VIGEIPLYLYLAMGMDGVGRAEGQLAKRGVDLNVSLEFSQGWELPSSGARR